MEPVSFLSAAAVSVPKVALGTGILPIPLYLPTVAAMAAATVQAFDPSRDLWIGLGVSSPVVAGRWHGADHPARPLERTREFVDVFRRALSGERVDADGSTYRVRGFRLDPALVPERPPRIVLAALNPKMFRLAGEVADGVLLNAVPASAVAAVAAQAHDAGNAHVFAYVHGSVGPSDLGDASARRSIAAESTADGYARMFTTAGYGSVVDAVRQRHAVGDREGARAAVPDEMCRDLFAFGSSAAVGEHLALYRSAGVVPLLSPELVTDDPAGELAATVDAAAPVVAAHPMTSEETT
jgi:alkanesulfonate monooxygenase SsuD/methylene tetrahydromethanopterin reductase-like flavin-dependent oxidoreductase (luciferase family)